MGRVCLFLTLALLAGSLTETTLRAAEAATPKGPYLGAGFEGNTLKVGEVVKNGPADKAGLRAGDVIVKLGDTKVDSPESLAKGLQKQKAGDRVSLEVERDGRARTLKVELGANPEDAFREVSVEAETRIDWRFAAGNAFGPRSAQVPADYDSGKQRYRLFVPKSYSKDKTWPLVVFISPSDDRLAWNYWRKPCEDLGMLYCAAYGAGNGCPVGRRTRIVLDMLDDVRRHYRIDPDQTYLTGFSGGGRMACSLAHALPEYFGGVVPICGTNPLSQTTYLRHRVRDRLSEAFVTGTGDFNRRENEDVRFPVAHKLGIRSKLWVVEGMGHGIPGPAVLTEVLQWLAGDLPRRQADAKARPGLAIGPGEAPSGEQQSARQLEAARAELKHAERTWRAVALAQGILQRWPKTGNAEQAQKLLEQVKADPAQAKLLAEQRKEEEQLEEKAAPKRPYLGVTLAGATLKVQEVEKGGPADKAGIRPGDVLTRLGDDKVDSRADLARLLLKRKPGQPLSLEVERDGKPMTLRVELGGRSLR
jgi:membrane-associated protease RseP (regulator of RpoE activity)/dienelactone hydrolase